jgi:hypothetical protein
LFANDLSRGEKNGKHVGKKLNIAVNGVAETKKANHRMIDL